MKSVLVASLLASLALAAACTARSSTPSTPAVPPATPSAPAATGALGAPAAVWFEGSYADALVQARATNRPVFIDFNTTWCGPCRKLEKETFSKPEVQAVLSKMVSMSIDAESPAGVPLAKQFRVSGYPEMLVLDPSGKEIGRISGFQPPDKFLARIEGIRTRLPK